MNRDYSGLEFNLIYSKCYTILIEKLYKCKYLISVLCFCFYYKIVLVIYTCLDCTSNILEYIFFVDPYIMNIR